MAEAMVRIDLGRTGLERFVTGKKDRSSCLLRVSVKYAHNQIACN